MKLEMLDRHRDDLRVGLLHALHGDDEARHAARAYLGLETTRGALIDAMEPPLRAGLLVFVAEELGAHVSEAIPAAVALELLRAASDLHAEIAGEPTTVRRRPAAASHTEAAVAIHAGDVMIPAALETVLRTSTDVLPCLLDAWRDSLDGRATRRSFGSRWPALSELRALIQLETAAGFRAACEMGGILAHAPAETLRRLASFGEGLGMAWGIREDLLGVWGDPEDAQRPPAAHLRARAHGYPLIAAYDTGTESDRRTLERATKGEPSDADIDRILGILERLAIRAETENRIREQLRETAQHVPYVPFSESALQMLTDLFDRLSTFAASNEA